MLGRWGRKAAVAFTEPCAAQAKKADAVGHYVACNGMVLEQAQILTTRNLTALLHGLGLTNEVPRHAADVIDKAAQQFASPDRTVQPAMEFIATVADDYPGPDGAYSHQVAAEEVQRCLDVARQHHQLFILDVQPGSQDFMSAVQPWRDLLSQPVVGLALDTEWRMDPGEVPGSVIGHVGAPEVNQVLDWVAGLTRTVDLPQKVVVLHMFRASMVTDLQGIAEHPELALVQHLDGVGGVETKMDIYHAIAAPGKFHIRFKLFYTQDHPLLGAPDVLGMKPQPEFVSYQ